MPTATAMPLAFDLVSLDFLEAILAAAEKTWSPVILSLAESHFEYCDFAGRREARGAGQGGPGCDFADRREARGAGQGGPGCDFELAMAATVTAARRASVPVAIHLDHGASFDSAVRPINRGCNGVMVDASSQRFAANVAATRTGGGARLA